MSKGTRREREFVNLCKMAGMGTYRPATVQYGENDMMGLFDVLAFSPAHRAIHAVQVKSNGATGIEAWTGHTRLFRQLGMRTFYAVPYDREGWRLILVGGDSTEIRMDVVDERDMSCNMGEGVVQYLENRRRES